nr:hypothetical protein [Kofleriaceae bacterium]
MFRPACLILTLWLYACGGPHAQGAIDASPGGDASADAAADAAPVDAGSAGDPLLALTQLPGICSVDGWCWQMPTPHGNDYWQLFSPAPNDIWMTAEGTVMHWTGAAWSIEHPPVLAGTTPSQVPFSIWDSSPTNAWLIYGSTLQQYDGATWTIRSSLPTTGNPGYVRVWVDPHGDAWVTRTDGKLEHWSGDKLVATVSPCSCSLGNLWGTSPTDIYVTTLPAGIWHFDGTSFTNIYAGPAILAGYQGAPGDVWVSGSEGALLHGTGSALAPVTLPDAIATSPLMTADYSGPNDVSWWATNPQGFVHWDGSAMSFTPATVGYLPPLAGVQIIDGTWWFAGDAGSVSIRSGDSIVPVVSEVGDDGQDRSLWGTSASDMYFAVSDHVVHFDGSASTTVVSVGDLDATPPVFADIGGWPTGLAGIQTGGVDELFAAGLEEIDSTHFDSFALRFDGSAWTKTTVATSSSLAKVTGLGLISVLGPGDAIAVGSKGLAWHFTAGAWQVIDTQTTADLMGVYAPDADHAWILAANNTLLEWQRSAPATVSIATAPSTTSTLGPIAGENGVIWIASPGTSSVFRGDGTTWTEVDGAMLGGVTAGLLATSDSDVLSSAAGQRYMARYNGSAFVLEDSMSDSPQIKLFRPPGGPTFAAGLSGVVVHP